MRNSAEVYTGSPLLCGGTRSPTHLHSAIAPFSIWNSLWLVRLARLAALFRAQGSSTSATWGQMQHSSTPTQASQLRTKTGPSTRSRRVWHEHTSMSLDRYATCDREQRNKEKKQETSLLYIIVGRRTTPKPWPSDTGPRATPHSHQLRCLPLTSDDAFASAK